MFFELSRVLVRYPTDTRWLPCFTVYMINNKQNEVARIEATITGLYEMMLDAKTEEERTYCEDAIESYENTLAQLAEDEYFNGR